MRCASCSTRAAGLLLGLLADTLLGDPRQGHPVAGFGALAALVERRAYRDTRAAGVAYLAALAGSVAAAAALAERSARGRPLLHAGLTACATWLALGGASLAREGTALAAEVDGGDLGAARRRLPGLCGRDPAVLDNAGLLRAGIESVAENTSDAAVAPLLWGALGGVPGLLGYRAVNTLDAMVGYRSPRYTRFGWASARADDTTGLVPSRVTGLLVAALAPIVGGSPAAALRVWRRDAGAHPSPNAGVAEAAMAGALGVRLGGVVRYAHGAEHRPVLGDGRPPVVRDLRRAVRLSRLVGAAAGALAALAAACHPVR